VEQPTAAWSALWRALLWPRPGYYAALAAVWIALLGFRQTLDEGARPGHPKTCQMSPEARLVLLQQRQELRRLLTAPELAAPPPSSEMPVPRSQRGQDLRPTAREERPVWFGASLACDPLT
jgi:hypothetical protein